ncbi:MAG: UDP-3-O-(3-hydroxymyristoyl)glucosamine N-acyltransferase [Bdellovibrionota bacterium]
MSISAEQILNEFSSLIAYASGDKKQTAVTPSSQLEPKAQSIVFVSDAKILPSILNSLVNIIVTTPALASEIKSSSKTVLSSKDVYFAMSQVNSKFFPKSFLTKAFEEKAIHSTAIVHPTAQLGAGVILGPGVVISEGCTIGAGTVIGANSVVQHFTTIGENCHINPNVTIGHNVRIGHRCEFKSNSVIGSDGYGYAHDAKGNHYKIPHYGELIIEDDVHVGAVCAIDRGTYEPSVIGAGTKIDNHCHFGHNVRIGKNCLITAGFRSAGSATIGDNCIFGGASSVNGKINICSGVTIAPHSAVTNDITEPGVYGGYPPIPFKEFLKVQASLASLPRIRKNVAKMMKNLGFSEEKN